MLEIRCPNGHKLRVPPDYVGHPGTCTECRRRFIIGGDPDEEVPEPFLASSPAFRSPSFPPSRSPGHSRWASRTSPRFRALFSITLSVAGFLALFLVVIANIPSRPLPQSGQTLVDKGSKGAGFNPANPHSEQEKFKESQRRLTEIADAIRRYQLETRTILHPVMPGKNGNPPYSWRIAILPYIKAKSLQVRYRFEEPWDSPHNLQLIPLCPDVYRSPFDSPYSTKSGYFLIDGPGAFFQADGVLPGWIGTSDGLALMIVEAKRDVPWTKPDEIPLNRSQPCQSFGGFLDNRFTFVAFDHAAHIGTIRPDRMSAFFMKDGTRQFEIKLFGDPPRELVSTPSSRESSTPQPATPSPPGSNSSDEAVQAKAKAREEAQRIARENQQRIETDKKRQDEMRARREAEMQLNQQRELILRDLPLHRRAAEIALKQVVRGLIRYQAIHGRFPSTVLKNPATNTTYSWRVELLPYVDQQDLYKQYRKDLPWDSPENLQIVQSIPAVYRGLSTDSQGNTSCLALIGPKSIFEHSEGSTLAEVQQDGLMNSPSLVWTPSQIPWTKPEDLKIGKEWTSPPSQFDDGQIRLANLLGGVAVVDRSTFLVNPLGEQFNASFQAVAQWQTRNRGSSEIAPLGRIEIFQNVDLLTAEINENIIIRHDRHVSPLVRAHTTGPVAQSFARLILLQAAINRFQQDHGRYPSPIFQDRPEGPIRSWRVELLPYLGHRTLYEQYRKDEPWDSPENAKVTAQVPEVYRNPFFPDQECPYVVIVGPRTPFEGTVGKTPQDIKDSVGQTIFVVEQAHCLPWTKPEDLSFDTQGSIPDLSCLTGRFTRFSTGDFSVHSVQTNAPAEEWRSLIHCSDGNSRVFERLEGSFVTLAFREAYIKLGNVGHFFSYPSAADFSLQTHQNAAGPIPGESRPVANSPGTEKTPGLPTEILEAETALVADSLKKSILALEEGDISEFYETYAPLVEFEEMKQRGILKMERVPFLPREAQQWLTTLRGFAGISPKIEPDGLTAVFSLPTPKTSTSSEPQASPARPPLEPQVGAGFGDEIHVVLEKGIAALQSGDYAAFVDKFYPAGELLRLELDGQKDHLINRLKNQSLLVTRMLADLKDCHGSLPQYNPDRTLVTFQIEPLESLDVESLRSEVHSRYGPAPLKVFKFQMSGESWRFYDHTLEVLRGIERQSAQPLPFDADDAPRLEFEKIDGKWRLQTLEETPDQE